MALTEIEISQIDRIRAIGRLDELAEELLQLATWLARGGHERGSILAENSARDCWAAAWCLQRTVRTGPSVTWAADDPATTRAANPQVRGHAQ